VNQEIKNRDDIQVMINTEGWKLLKKVIDLKKETLKMMRDSTNSAEDVLACVRQEDGIMFIEEAIAEIIETGNNAELDI
jgi:hypothetical protein